MLTGRKVCYLGLLSIFSLIFSLVALLGSPKESSDDIYMDQGETFACSRSAYTLDIVRKSGEVEHDHDFQHIESDTRVRDVFWERDGLSFDPAAC